MKRTTLLILLCGPWLSGCAPQVTPAAIPTLPRTTTATPPPVVGGIATSPSRTEGDDFSLEFTHEVSSGLATLHASAHTCSGIRGPWEGAFQVDLSYGPMQISGSGPFVFTVPEDGSVAHGDAPFTGAGSVAGSTCVILDVSDPLRYEITMAADGGSASITMGSTGGGTITSQCGDNPPVTIPFAIAWGPNPISVPIIPYDGCPQP
jgi:hypothetical protein